jgi:hypothetical protein
MNRSTDITGGHVKCFNKPATALAISILMAIPIWAKPNIANLAYQCDTLRKQNACRELAKLAEHDKDPAVRVQAITSLTDQTLLGRLATQDDDPNARRAAVTSLTDQTVLATVASDDKDANVRKAAVERLTDQPLLAKLAAETQDVDVRNGAMRKLTDQALLGKLALEGLDKTLRIAALGKLTDQSLLAKIVMEIKDVDVRDHAMEKLADQVLLGKIAESNFDDGVRAAAVRKLTDQSLLAKIVLQDQHQAVRRSAVEHLTDETLLAKLALDDKDAQVRATAAGKLTDQVLLAKIAAGDRDDTVRSTAQQQLRNQQAEAAAHSALIAAFRQAGIHILEWPTGNDPIRKAAEGTNSGVLYLSSYGMIEAKFLSLTPAMVAYLDGKDGIACVNGTNVSLEQFNKSLLGKGIIAFYLNLARTSDNKEDWGNRRMALVKLSDQIPLPAIDPMTRVDSSLWVALLGSCQNIRSGAYLGPGR